MDSGEARFRGNNIEAMTIGGWKFGQASGHYQASTCNNEDLIIYQKEVWPERWETSCKTNPRNSERVLSQKVLRGQELKDAGNSRGELDLFRKYFKSERLFNSIVLKK
ncbi:hypothetical protein [Pistricoccus aurantiacus]|uniref:hypothetical protein n=1 Tax=Pistricoccus aurantiacus TaxID=1883414 RepID=UPI00362ADA93